MNNDDISDKLKEALHICEIHSQRMNYAFNKVEKHFPLNVEKYKELSFDDLSYLDQLVFRFSKLARQHGQSFVSFNPTKPWRGH